MGMNLSGEKIAIAQIASFRGDIARNIEAHADAIRSAHDHGVSLVLFPELSLTGYELDLAENLAFYVEDPRLSNLAKLTQALEIQAVVGAPLHSGLAKPYLGAVIFSAAGNISTYCKMHLGGDEPLYFEPGEDPKVLHTAEHKVGLAICADTSCRSHPETCVALGADVYAASVFLTEEWFEGDSPRLQTYAKRYGVLTLLANQGASVGTLESWGRSSAWGPDGELLGQVKSTESVLLIVSKSAYEWRTQIVSL